MPAQPSQKSLILYAIWMSALAVVILWAAYLVRTVLLQQFENHVLVPKIMERQVGVSAVTVIVALLIGASLMGVLGAVLAVPSAAILQVVFNEVTGARERRGTRA